MLKGIKLKKLEEILKKYNGRDLKIYIEGYSDSADYFEEELKKTKHNN